MKNSFIKYFKNVCLETSKLSSCYSKQVGSVLVKKNRIIAIGYNGVKSGEKHCCELFKNNFDREKHHEWSKQNEYHAEENTLMFCLREGISTKDSIIFISLSPCINCAKLISNSGIKKVFYIEEYDKDKTGIDFLKSKNIEVEKI